MKKRAATFLGLLVLTGVLWIGTQEYTAAYIHKAFNTAIILSVLYFLFKLVFEPLIDRRIEDAKTRYSFRKMVSVLYFTVFLAAVSGIWIENPQSLLVAYGLLGAGVAISLQDVFKNFAGGVVIFLSDMLQIGDRVDMDSVTGDVIDVGMMYTTIMEIQGWVDGDQATGRITTVPNAVVLANNVHNYTKDYSFLWEELKIPLTFDSDWRKAREIILDIVNEATQEAIETAEREAEEVKGKYYLSKRSVEPNVYMTITDNWIDFKVRFVVDARKRRRIHNKIQEDIWEAFEDRKDITIASENIEISRIPDLNGGS